MRQTSFLLLIIFINVGCEKQATISYKVANQSAQTIKVIFYNTNGYDNSTYNKTDSVFIGVNTEQLIVVQLKGLSRVSRYKESDTYLREFKYLEIYQQSVKSKTNFLLSSKWTYVKKDRHQADHKCIVTQSNF